MGVIPYILLDVIRFPLAWPPTASSVGISVYIVWSVLVGLPRCKQLLGHTISHEVPGFSASEAVIISVVVIAVWAWVCLLLLFSKELLDCCCKDFQLSCYFCFGIVTGLWLGHHKPCFIPFGCIYGCL